MPSSTKTVVFIDSNVQDDQNLVDQVQPGTLLFLLNPNQDGIQQITPNLSGLTNTKSSLTLGSYPSLSSEIPTIPAFPAAKSQVIPPIVYLSNLPMKTEVKLLQNIGESVDDPFHDMGMTKTGSSALGEMLTSSKVGGFLPKASLFLDPNPSRSNFQVGLPSSFLTSTEQVNFPKSNTVINVNYTGFTPAAQTAFQFAVDIWESLLDSSVPINVNASFANLGSGILGQAGPEDFFRNFSGAPQTNTWYPVALANSLAGQDLDPTASDIGSEFNSNFNWYYGLDNNVPTNQISFVSVVLHELGHGLGFLGLMNNQSGVGSWGFGTGFPGIYDRFTENGSGQSLLNTSLFPNPSTALGSQLTSNNIFFDGSNANAANGGNRVKLYAPSTWSGGSSYSHLDEVFNNTPNALMTYSIGFGESILNPGPVTLGLFKDMGWKLAGSSTNLVTVAATDADAGEPTNNGQYTLTRTGDTTSALTVNIAMSGTATNGTDYTTIPTTVTFAAGSSTAVVNLNVTDDTLIEGAETAILTVTSGTGYTVGTSASATVNIADNDLPVITVAATDANAAETVLGTTPNPGQYTLTRTGPTTSSLTVNVSLTGTAINGTDYTTIPTTVTFAAGSSTALVDLNVI
ncbi:Calx-beta domain-containing protein, partial [Dolichospermum circinale CS-541/06]